MFDLILTYKAPEEKDLKLYDIVVYEIDDIYNMSTDEARTELMKLKGVGRKVADCILLFGYHKTDVFPTDTWVVQAYNKIYNDNKKDAIAISKFFVEMFGDLSDK